MNKTFGCGVVALVGVMTWSCALSSDHFSCAIEVNGSLARCVDYSNVSISVRETIETLCAGFGGDFSTKNRCPDSGKLGGCVETGQVSDQTTWYYMTELYKTPADISCSGGSHFVNPDGSTPDMALSAGQDMTVTSTPDQSVQLLVDMSLPTADLYSPDGMTCAAVGGANAVESFVNGTGATVSGFALDGTCTQSYQFTMHAGDTSMAASYQNQTWYLRAGDNDPNGKIVKVCQTDNADPHCNLP